MGSGKPAALLAFLGLAARREALRDELIELLWCNLDPERARLSLRQALFQIRSALGADAIAADRTRIRLAEDVAVDALDFRSAADADLPDALERYSGHFLDGISFPGAAMFEQWAERERSRLGGTLKRWGRRHIDGALTQGRRDESVSVARSVRDLFPRDQDAWLVLIETALAAGDRPLARVEADVLARWLADDGIEASDAVTGVLKRLHRGELGGAEAGDRFEAEFVGREAELSLLLTAAYATATGEGRHAHVQGPAGIGKTRLLREFAHRCRGGRTRGVLVSALPSDRTIPFAYCARIAERLGALPGAGAVAPASAAILVAMAPTLSLVFRGTDRPRDIDPLGRALALRDLIESVGAERPLVLLLDDLHWADPPSVAALQRLAEDVPRHVYLVTSSRPPLVIAGQRRSVQRELTPLSDEQVRAMLLSLGLMADQDRSRDAVAAITAASGGSPLYVLQLVREGLEEGWLRRDGHVLAVTLTIRELRAATGLDPIGRRLGALCAEDAEVMLILACHGAALDAGALAAITGRDVAPSLARLSAVELVSPAHEGWMCAHDIIAEQVIARTPGAARADVQGQLGRALASRAGEMSAARLAARHLIAAGDHASLTRLAERLARSQRSSGLPGDGALVVSELVGEELGAAEQRRLVQGLPWNLRIRRRRFALAGGAVALAVAVLALYWSRATARHLAVMQLPLSSTPLLSDQKTWILRPPLIVEVRDARGRLVVDRDDSLELALRDSITGERVLTRVPLINGRATVERIVGRQLAATLATVRAPHLRDSAQVPIRFPREYPASLSFQAFDVAGVSVTPRTPTLRVPPGAGIAGDVTVAYTTRLSDETIVYAWTPTWGDPARQVHRLGYLSSPFTNRLRTDALAFIAPRVAGEYFVVLIAVPEEDERFALSGTNWALKRPVWGDGNDVAAWNADSLRQLALGHADGISATYLTRFEGVVQYMPRRFKPAVLRVVVDPSVKLIAAE